MSKRHAYKQIHAYVNFKTLRLHYIDFYSKNPVSGSKEAEKIFFPPIYVELGVTGEAELFYVFYEEVLPILVDNLKSLLQKNDGTISFVYKKYTKNGGNAFKIWVLQYFMRLYYNKIQQCG